MSKTRHEMLLTPTESGLYCPAGDFFIDPWQPVKRAIVTHAHADHARRGSRSYLAARAGEAETQWSQALIVAPPSAQATPWLRRFGRISTSFASGWMRVRGQRRRRSVDRGFVISDHADWPSLMQVIGETGARRVLVTHGYVAPVVRWLREQGLEAYGLETRFEGEQEDVE